MVYMFEISHIQAMFAILSEAHLSTIKIILAYVVKRKNL
ncbi:hypothetical protein SAMN05444005_10666 [Flavobacterium urocaniciphilum]|uniref:Uncharacterized protein n=1 Tax=Flavobacterium urocaniciphilum TaxID=1299341 RepID=A0A1H9D6Q5_9FLAO|nr:hypothetical protein SAMN05444005_10666 [Flavobacterium urocaniciphilum]